MIESLPSQSACLTCAAGKDHNPRLLFLDLEIQMQVFVRKVVARIVGVSPTGGTGVARLRAAGVASWKEGKPEGANFKLQAGGKPMSIMVLEDRG